MIESVIVGTRAIGPGLKPLLIAEISANHNGSLDTALRLVREAATAGADAVKLQTYTAATLTIDSRRPEFFIDDPGGPWHGRRLWELYDEAHTPWEWHEPIFREARGLGLLCLSTAFCEKSLDFLVGLDVDALKIASFELIHTPLLAAAAKTGKPILLSTGMGTEDEISQAVSTLRAAAHRQFVLLKCTSAYPATEDYAHVRTMADMRDRYSCVVGLSDHTLQPYTSYAAVALGAAVVEKHVILNRQDGGPDSSFSLEPDEFRELARGIDAVWRSLGDVVYRTHDVEAASAAERPSIYVTQALVPGDVFTPANTRVIRPGAGLPPRELARVLGAKAQVPIEAGTPMQWRHVAPAELNHEDETS